MMTEYVAAKRGLKDAKITISSGAYKVELPEWTLAVAVYRCTLSKEQIDKA